MRFIAATTTPMAETILTAKLAVMIFLVGLCSDSIYRMPQVMNRMPSQNALNASVEPYKLVCTVIPNMFRDTPMITNTIPIHLGSPLRKRCKGLSPPVTVVMGSAELPVG